MNPIKQNAFIIQILLLNTQLLFFKSIMLSTFVYAMVYICIVILGSHVKHIAFGVRTLNCIAR